MTDNETRCMAEAWKAFDLSLRDGHGFNEIAFNELCEALRGCSAAWAGSDVIPRLAVNIMVDIFPSTEGNAELYDAEVSEKIMESAYKLQELVWDCVAI